MTRSGTAISARGMRKSFGEHTVLDDVDLEVGEGTIFALLGPNGAGKTTIVRILSTLIRAEAGTIRVAGHDLAADPDGVRAAIGVTGHFSAVDNLLTGEKNLQLMADLRHLGRAAGRRRVAELLDRFELTDAARKPLSAYSGGMLRRLDLAMTLVGDPRLIFLDEPTTGLEPSSPNPGEHSGPGPALVFTKALLAGDPEGLRDRVRGCPAAAALTACTPPRR